KAVDTSNICPLLSTAYPTHLGPCSPYFSKPGASESKIHRPPDHLVSKFVESCFHCRRTGHWCADCPQTWGVTNPNPRPSSPGPWHAACSVTPECRTQPPTSPHYQREHVWQVKFVKHDAADQVLIDTSVSIHLSGSLRFLTALRISPLFKYFLPIQTHLSLSHRQQALKSQSNMAMLSFETSNSQQRYREQFCR
ncbi:hypothetical protein O181_075676, partial [Austropuccinia psidii MF-1]|nr:hypothetical protein [Austropuccinia psidii MF-1]